MRSWNILCLIALACWLSSCTQVGPSYLPQNRQAYNSAMQVSGNEQILLNIVRMRYNDSPYFLDVSAISSSIEFDVSASPSLSLTNTISRTTQSNSRTTGFEPKFTYREKPIISYRPFEGKSFSQLLLQPVGLNAIMQLYHAGYNPNKIIHIVINRLAYLQNVNGVNDATINDHRLKEFVTFLNKTQYLLAHNIILIKPSLYNSRELLGLYFIGKAQDETAYRELLNLLGIPNFHKTLYFITSYEPKVDELTYGISTRTLLGILNYLSMGVDVPTADLKAKVVHNINSKQQQARMRQLLWVKVSANKPNNAYLSVYYKGYWFYIADTDVESRKTIALVWTLFEMLDDSSYQTQPIIVSS